MRAKHILNLLPLATKVRLVYDRFTVTSVATAFVFAALAHCIAQISLQAIAYSANTAAGNTISQLIRQSNVTGTYAFVEDGILKICDDPMNMDSCQTVASTHVTVNADFGGPAEPAGTPADLFVVRNLSVFRRDFNLSEISFQCIEALTWPHMILSDARREDVCFLVFQVWLLGISLVTVLNESIPHLVTALITHAMSSTWSVFQVYHTSKYGDLYKTLVVGEACGGVNVLSGFWAKRMDYFVPILVLNVVAFTISAIVSYRLFSVYAHQTFRRVGYSDKMNVLYSCLLTFSVALQLSAFFLACASALWLDGLFNGILAIYAANKTADRIISIHVCVWTLPWIWIGWVSVRREHRLWMTSFFLIGCFMLGAWISVFPTTLFKEKFRCFPFFASMSVTSFVILTITLILGLYCRMNFGRGLSQYLKSQDLIDESSFVPVFLTRKRQTMLPSVVFPDKTVRRVALHSQNEKQPSNPGQHGVPPAYGVEMPQAPSRSYTPESVRKSDGQQHQRRYCPRSWTNSKVRSADVSAIIDESCSVSRPVGTLLSSEFYGDTHSRHSCRSEEYDSHPHAWETCKGMPDPKPQSRASAPPPLWRSPGASSISLLCKTNVDSNDIPSTVGTLLNEHHCSPSFPASALSPPPLINLPPKPSFPRRTPSLSANPSAKLKSQPGGFGLPPNPKYLKG